MNRRTLHAGLGIAIIVFGFFLWSASQRVHNFEFFTASALPVVNTEAPMGERIAAWQARIRANGAAGAYVLLVRSAEEQGLNGIERHTLGHLFGEALYSEIGIEGFLICDQRTEYGCLHEIAARALIERGIQAIYDINDLCVQEFGALSYNCQHGIGHGLLANTSYAIEDRDEALARCADLPHNNFHSACNSGVFMEYMLHSSLGDENNPTLAYKGDIVEPCRDLATDKLAGACSLRLPDWWMQTTLPPTTDAETLSALGTHCIQTGKELNINDSLCFSGIGNSLILQEVYNPEFVVRVCETASSDIEDQFWCKKVAAKHLLAGTELHEALRVCKSMDDPYAAMCTQEVQERDRANQEILLQEFSQAL